MQSTVIADNIRYYILSVVTVCWGLVWGKILYGPNDVSTNFRLGCRKRSVIGRWSNIERCYMYNKPENNANSAKTNAFLVRGGGEEEKGSRFT